MTLIACGINHLTAPLDIRERLAFTKERAQSSLEELLKHDAVNEAIILSTCNRIEIYGDTSDACSMQDWLNRHFHLPLDSHGYLHTEKYAVSHIMRVACGLDSMVLGEPQILGQMKDAFALAKEAGSVGVHLQRLFQRVFNVSKQVRSDTNIGANPITLGYAAVTLAKRLFTDLAKCSVLLIGAGDVIELAALHLYNQGIKRFIVASRSLNKAQSLAEKIYGHWISMTDVPIYLKESDIVISATASDLPILGKGAVEQAIKARKHKPIFMVDLAVPRDIEPEVASLGDVYLYNIDDLKTVIDDSHQCRESAAKEAEAIIELQAHHYIRELQSLNANRLIKQFRDNLGQLSQLELQKALSRIDQGADATQVLTQFARNLLNKISHTPCMQIKQAAYDGRLELLALARQLLDLR